MALRGLWLIGHEQGGRGNVLFSRRYPTVEMRAKRFNGASYVGVPEDGPFLKALLFELRLTGEEHGFVERQDGCGRINKTAVYGLQTDRGDLWPVVAFQKSGLIYAAVPLAEQPLTPRPALATLSGVSQAFSLLSGLLAFMNSSQKSEADRQAKVGQLPSLLAHACPLGTPLQTNLGGPSPEINPLPPGGHPQRPPAWRSCPYKGRPQVSVGIVEKVKSVQYDNRDVADTWQVYGAVSCKCDIEGPAPNVSVSLNLPANGSPLQDILVHPCVTSVDAAVLTSSSVDGMDDSAFSGPYKFPLTPPPDQFTLCCYTSQVPVPPILGFYQLKEEESQWKLSLHLKLHESVKNTFEYCEARIPFFNRGPIAHLEYKISYGQLEVSKEKSLLVWVIGQKFPKSLEISLTGTVSFGPSSPQQATDPVCTGNTAYIKLYFRILDFTLTGCYTDQHSVQVFAAGKPKISAGQKFPKSLEISLTGTVAFGPASPQQATDPVCTGNTAYVKLYFRILDFTLTGCYTDQHSVQVFAAGKPKISAAREVLSSDYYIWNSKAPAPVVYRTLLF